jgi:hypothetical protein
MLLHLIALVAVLAIVAGALWLGCSSGWNTETFIGEDES